MLCLVDRYAARHFIAYCRADTTLPTCDVFAGRHNLLPVKHIVSEVQYKNIVAMQEIQVLKNHADCRCLSVRNHLVNSIPIPDRKP